MVQLLVQGRQRSNSLWLRRQDRLPLDLQVYHEIKHFIFSQLRVCVCERACARVCVGVRVRVCVCVYAYFMRGCVVLPL